LSQFARPFVEAAGAVDDGAVAIRRLFVGDNLYVFGER
jgi:hypothetical protein